MIAGPGDFEVSPDDGGPSDTSPAPECEVDADCSAPNASLACEDGVCVDGRDCRVQLRLAF